MGRLGTVAADGNRSPSPLASASCGRHDRRVTFPDWQPGPNTPLRPDEIAAVRSVLAAAAAHPPSRSLVDAVVTQARNLDSFGDLLARYPSPLEEQILGERRRGLDTLVQTLCEASRAALLLRAPTQAVVGRALHLAQVNFFRLLRHVTATLPDDDGATLRADSARLLRRSIYAQLVEEVLSDLVTDESVPRELRARAVRHLALLWGHRLTWRVDRFFPMLETTWEARSRVRVVGGTFLGASELLQLLLQGAEPGFVEILTGQQGDPAMTLAFREFLFGRSSEELERLTDRMAREGLSSLAIDSRGDEGLDAGSLFHEFFHLRHQLALARRLTGQPGPQRTAEGYVVLGWLQQDGADAATPGPAP